MRYSDRMRLLLEPGTSKYDPRLGREVKTPGIYRTIPCHISPLNIERTNELFGDFQKEIMIIRCRKVVSDTLDHVQVNGVDYEVLRVVTFRGRSDIYVEGSHES